MGRAVDWIAQKLKCGRSTVYRLFKRKVSEWAGVFSNGKESCTQSLFDSTAVENAIPNETSADEVDELDAINQLGRSIPDLLKQHWKGRSPRDVLKPEVSPAYPGMAN